MRQSVLKGRDNMSHPVAECCLRCCYMEGAVCLAYGVASLHTRGVVVYLRLAVVAKASVPCKEIGSHLTECSNDTTRT